MPSSWIPSLEEFRSLVKLELAQMYEEGFDVEELVEDTEPIDGMGLDELTRLYDRLRKASPRRGYPYTEPSDLDGIRSLRPKGPRRLELEYPVEGLEDRILGAWLGRCIGCLVGKPVEGFDRGLIERYLKAAGEYPPRGYLPALDREVEGLPSGFSENRRGMLRGGIECMPRDDDIDYTILNLHVLETHGFGFTTDDVGLEWLDHLPYRATYTAERAAYRNLVLGLKPPETAVYMNPYREWIGAQIRADLWSYVAPGLVEYAAGMAYRDATLSHVKNGVYGEMFVAATVSAAFAVDSVEEALKAGLTEVPSSSRFAEVVENVMRWSKADRCWGETWEKVTEAYGGYHRAHVLNNAAMVVLSLMHGEGDFMKSVGIAVMCGLDTDCNCATVGSILGALKGLKSIPDRLVKPLNDRVRSMVAGFDGSSITGLARRTLKLALEKLNE